MTHLPDTPATPLPRSRPGTVTAAVAVQSVIIITLLLLAGFVLATAIQYNQLISRAARTTGTTGADVSDERWANAVPSTAAITVLVLLAAYFTAFVVPLARGRNYARIATWVGSGIPLVLGLLCGVVGVTLGALAGEDPASGGDVESTPFYDELDRLSAEESPVWYVLGVVAALILLGLLIALAVLLLLPPSNGYFRSTAVTGPRPVLPVYGYPYYPGLYPAPVPPPAGPPEATAPEPADRTDQPSDTSHE